MAFTIRGILILNQYRKVNETVILKLSDVFSLYVYMHIRVCIHGVSMKII